MGFLDGLLLGLLLASLGWNMRLSRLLAEERAERRFVQGVSPSLTEQPAEPSPAAARSYGTDEDEWAVENRRRGRAGLPELPAGGE